MASDTAKAFAMGCGITAGVGCVLVLLLAVVGAMVGNPDEGGNRMRADAPPPPPPPPPADIERPGDASTPESEQAEEETAEPDLAVIRARLEREMKLEQSTSGRVYRIHELTYQCGTLVLWVDLQFRPESEAFLRQDARAWTELMLHAKCGERYVCEMPIRVRTSMCTVVGPDELVLYGGYRVSNLPDTTGTWTPQNGAKLARPE